MPKHYKPAPVSRKRLSRLLVCNFQVSDSAVLVSDASLVSDFPVLVSDSAVLVSDFSVDRLDKFQGIHKGCKPSKKVRDHRRPPQICACFLKEPVKETLALCVGGSREEDRRRWVVLPQMP